MPERDTPPTDGISLSEAIGLLRDELLRTRAAGADSDIQLPVESMTVELSVIVTRSADGKAEFMVPVTGMQIGNESCDRVLEHKVTVVFGGPLDRDGNPVKVAASGAKGIEDWDR